MCAIKSNLKCNMHFEKTILNAFDTKISNSKFEFDVFVFENQYNKFFFVFVYLFIFLIIEKFFIVQTHMFINLRQIKKCQYKYSNHVVNFMQNTTKIVYKFSNLFSKLQMFIF